MNSTRLTKLSTCARSQRPEVATITRSCSAPLVLCVGWIANPRANSSHARIIDSPIPTRLTDSVLAVSMLLLPAAHPMLGGLSRLRQVYVLRENRSSGVYPIFGIRVRLGAFVGYACSSGCGSIISPCFIANRPALARFETPVLV